MQCVEQSLMECPDPTPSNLVHGLLRQFHYPFNFFHYPFDFFHYPFDFFHYSFNFFHYPFDFFHYPFDFFHYLFNFFHYPFNFFHYPFNFFHYPYDFLHHPFNFLFMSVLQMGSNLVQIWIRPCKTFCRQLNWNLTISTLKMHYKVGSQMQQLKMHHDSENLQLANRHYLSFLARQELSIFVSQVTCTYIFKLL